MKRGMPLGNKIGLTGKPQAIPFRVRDHDQGRIVRRRARIIGHGGGSLVCHPRLLPCDTIKRQQTAGEEQAHGAPNWKEARHINYSKSNL
jgi:hypothetical protein